MNDIKDCVYCAEDKCRLCTLFCDYWGDGGSDKCSAEGNEDPYNGVPQEMKQRWVYKIMGGEKNE